MATGKDPREMPLDLYCDAVYAWLRNRVSQSENAEREWRRVTDELWRDARPEPDRTGGHGLETFATGLASLAR